MTLLRCLLVDDERLARLELSALLAEAGGCTVIAEAANAPQALQLIPLHQPDVVFLDINMPGTNGFELLSQLESCPLIVFVTAYDQFAIQAFEVHALDYLMKPVRPNRLATTLDRVRQQLNTNTKEKIFLANRAGGRFVELSDIYLVRAYDHYVRIYHSAGNDLLHQPLGRFTARLPADDYFKANRSEVIRTDAVTSINNLSRGRYELLFPSGERVVVAERRSVAWRRRFG